VPCKNHQVMLSILLILFMLFILRKTGSAAIEFVGQIWNLCMVQQVVYICVFVFCVFMCIVTSVL